jgi:hypothetical protein
VYDAQCRNPKKPGIRSLHGGMAGLLKINARRTAFLQFYGSSWISGSKSRPSDDTLGHGNHFPCLVWNAGFVSSFPVKLKSARISTRDHCGRNFFLGIPGAARIFLGRANSSSQFLWIGPIACKSCAEPPSRWRCARPFPFSFRQILRNADCPGQSCFGSSSGLGSSGRLANL